MDVQSSAVPWLPEESGRSSERPLQGEGNIPDFDDVYRDWFHEVCRWARALGGLHADVEDIAQEVFLVVRRKLVDFDGSHPGPWLYRITQRTVSDYRRRAWFRRTVRPAADFFQQLVDPADGPREVAQQRQAEETVARILDRMSKVRRSAFILHEIEGYSGDEIAVLEGVPVGTVYTRLHHARKDFVRLMPRGATKGQLS
jgi:RNA polymerase sigma-70 factor (ECF subfamily)